MMSHVVIVLLLLFVDSHAQAQGWKKLIDCNSVVLDVFSPAREIEFFQVVVRDPVAVAQFLESKAVFTYRTSPNGEIIIPLQRGSKDGTFVGDHDANQVGGLAYLVYPREKTLQIEVYSTKQTGAQTFDRTEKIFEWQTQACHGMGND